MDSNDFSNCNDSTIAVVGSCEPQHQQSLEQHNPLRSYTTHPSSRMWTRRIIMLISISFLVGGLIAVGAFVFISQSENTLAEAQFEAISKHALDIALDISHRKRLGAKSLATIISYNFPDATLWPNISLVGFEDIANSIIVSTVPFLGHARR